MKRPFTITLIQHGPGTDDKQKNLDVLLKLVDRAAEETKPDLIGLGEVFATKFFMSVSDNSFFEKYAEPIPGPTSEVLTEKARKHGCYIVGGLFEKGDLEGEYYNSAVVVGPDGVVHGVMPDGRVVRSFRKVHIPEMAQPIESHEKLYFKPGPGWPVFDLGKTKIGIIICYDVYFPEGPRILALRGAEIIIHPTSARFPLDERYVAMLRGIAASNQLFVAFPNKAGLEERAAPWGKDWEFFGHSLIINPTGNILAEAPLSQPFTYVSATIDLDEVRTTRCGLPTFRDRRPETYGELVK